MGSSVCQPGRKFRYDVIDQANIEVRAAFPNVIGALDCPRHSHSIVMLMICDAETMQTNIVVI